MQAADWIPPTPESAEALPPVNNLVVISDLHAGNQVGLCPPQGVTLDSGGGYTPNRIQQVMWGHWQEFWNEWVPLAGKGEPFTVVVNGDAIDGRHHKATDLVSGNLADQGKIAYEILAPVAELADGRFYMIRGTEAHAGIAGEAEEALAMRLGAVRDDETGTHSRFELWGRLGPVADAPLVHCLHHIGTTGRTHYESSAPMGELGELYTEAGRWGDDPPDVIVRSHRHRMIEIRVPSKRGYAIVCTTPGWQGKTPFTFKIAGGRVSTPQFGGTLIRRGDVDLYTRHKVWRLPRTREVRL